MDKILRIETQCNSRLKLKTLRTICITLIVLAVLVCFIVVMALNTITHYHEATVEVNSSSVNVELDLSR